MSTKSKNTFGSAEEVIERFGGIRPMSSKTQIPVTTIQGWKKRNSIPDARVDDILKAAQSNNVDIADLIQGPGANENANQNATAKADARSEDKTGHEPGVKTAAAKTAKRAAPEPKSGAMPEAQAGSAAPAAHIPQRIAPSKDADKDQNGDAGAYAASSAVSNGLEERLAKVEKNAVTKSAVISVLVVVLMIGAASALLWPKAKDVDARLDANNQQLSELEGQVQDIREGGSWAGGLIPQEWKDQLNEYSNQAAELQAQAMAAKETVGAALKRAEVITGDVLSAEAGTLEQRVAKLEAHLGDMAADPNMAYFLQKLKDMQLSVPGQETVDSAVSELLAMMNNFEGGPDTMNAYLDDMRGQSTALGQTFEGLPSEDLKAAALLFTMEQFRGALNRDGAAFEDDLALMKNFVGAEDNELSAALDKLAPQAKQGVLSVEGLSKEFRGLAGEAVVSSLKGEDVDFSEKAKARMNELLSVEKDGELVTGTETQAALAKVQSHLDAGELDAAIAEAETLDGPAAQTLQPWLEQARATSAAQDVASILDYNIDMRVPGTNEIGQAMQGMGDAVRGKGRMIEDPKSGLKIYLPARSIFQDSPLAAPKGLKPE